jgi:uncharacterized repeat protein (TIGR01451 family)
MLPALSITKTMAAAHEPLRLGEPITFTIVMTNAGNADATSVVITDTLPGGVVGDDLHWRGNVSAGKQVEFTIPAVVTTSSAFRGQTITNTASFHHATGDGSAAVAFALQSIWRLYFPAVARNASDHGLTIGSAFGR